MSNIDNENVSVEIVGSENTVDTLNPILPKDRVVTPTGFMMVLWSSFIAVHIMPIGLFLMYPFGVLNFMQVFVSCIIAGIVFAFVMAVNSSAGACYGIPVQVHLRGSLGLKGAKLVGILRSLPCIIWNGIASWYGAEAFGVVVATIFGWDHESLKYIFFLFLLAIQTVLVTKGFETVAWFDKVMSLVIFALLAYFFIVLFQTGNIDFTEAMSVEGSWGLPFFAACLTGIAYLSPNILNASDFARQIKFQGKDGSNKGVAGKTFLYVALGVMPPWIAMYAAGILVGVATKANDPIAGLAAVAPNAVFAVLLMVFLVLAQVSTNITLNHTIGAMIVKDMFPKLEYKYCATAVSVLSAVICPWILAGSSYFNWIQNIAAMYLGPATVIMIVDYYVVRRMKINIPALYDNSYKYTNGWNVPAWIALVAGWICAIFFPSYSWLAGFVVTGSLYLILKVAMKMDTKNDIL